jgi:DNA-binding NarL/FixJ family response regulator/signal transduction histidine kinase
MAAVPIASSTCDVVPYGNRNERLAAVIKKSRPGILRSFRRFLEESYGFALDDPRFIEQAMAIASDVISDVVRSLGVAEVRIADERKPNTWARQENCLSLVDALGATVMLLNIVTAELTAHVMADQELLPCFTIAVQSLNESIGGRMQVVAGASAASMHERVHGAQVEEQRRIARELHDRVGEVLSVGLRRLDLEEIAGLETPAGQARVAREVVVEAMRRLRTVTCDLREPPVANLEKALMRYLDSVRADAEVVLHVSGNQVYVPPAILDESFLILREAVRNALTHGAPQLVLIEVELDPHELSAWVLDNGCGFVPGAAGLAGVGTGLVSMRERAALMGGRVAVSSTPGHGARVELRIPLPEPNPTQDNVGCHDRTRILIVDDRMLVRDELRRIVESQEDMEVVGEAGDSMAAVAVAVREQPDIVLLDVEMPGGNATATVRQLRKSSPRSAVIILNMYEGPRLVTALLDAGIKAYLRKSVHWQELVVAIRVVHADSERLVLGVSGVSLGNVPHGPGTGAAALSEREREILGHVGQALSNGQIASLLSVKDATVERHLRSILVKLGAVSRTDAVNKAAELRAC